MSATTRLATDRTGAVLAIAGFTTIVGIAVAIAIAPNAWAVDAERNLRAAHDLLAGGFGTDHGYVYSPLAAALTVPWTWIPQQLAIALWLALRLGVLAVGTALATRDRPSAERLLSFVAVALFVPTLYDLLLGNVSILLAAAVALVAWRRDASWTGIALGIALATVPKPQLVPILVWMLAYRRRALLGTAMTAAAASLVGALALGTTTYAAWIGVLRAVDYLSSPMYGNLSLFAILPGPIALAAAVAAVAASAVALRRGEMPGLVACLSLGLLIAPYTLAYAAVLLLVALPAIAAAAPRATAVLGLSASLGVIVALPLWLAGVIAAALAVPGDRWPEA